MSIIACPECGKEMSDKADKCPHCGNPREKGLGCFSMGLITIFIIFVALWIASSILINEDKKHPKNHSINDYCNGHELLAYGYAEDFVKKKLKSPSSAKFPSASEKKKHTRSTYNCSYKIDSWVDSQNSFGAMLRTKFTCEIAFEGNDVVCKSLIFE